LTISDSIHTDADPKNTGLFEGAYAARYQRHHRDKGGYQEAHDPDPEGHALRVTPLAHKDVEELRKVVEDLYSYAQSVGGDIARLGEERIVITPPGVKIWRGAYDLK
jgi:hypothetical protein